MKVYTVHEVLESTKKKLAEVTAERDALAATVNALKMVIMLNCHDDPSTSGKQLIELANKTPQQALAEIRAEAVEKFSSALASRVEVPDASPTKIEYYKAAIRHVLQFASGYAAKLRQGGVE